MRIEEMNDGRVKGAGKVVKSLRKGVVATHAALQQAHPPLSLYPELLSLRSILPGIVPFVFDPVEFFFVGADLSELPHNSGVSMIFSTTSWNASFTPNAVLAEASMKREDMRCANCWPSVVDT